MLFFSELTQDRSLIKKFLPKSNEDMEMDLIDLELDVPVIESIIYAGKTVATDRLINLL